MSTASLWLGEIWAPQQGRPVRETEERWEEPWERGEHRRVSLKLTRLGYGQSRAQSGAPGLGYRAVPHARLSAASEQGSRSLEKPDLPGSGGARL